jgi:hypothetical protein
LYRYKYIESSDCPHNPVLSKTLWRCSRVVSPKDCARNWTRKNRIGGRWLESPDGISLAVFSCLVVLLVGRKRTEKRRRLTPVVPNKRRKKHSQPGVWPRVRSSSGIWPVVCYRRHPVFLLSMARTRKSSHFPYSYIARYRKGRNFVSFPKILVHLPRDNKSKSVNNRTPHVDSSHSQIQNDTIVSNTTIRLQCTLSF